MSRRNLPPGPIPDAYLNNVSETKLDNVTPTFTEPTNQGPNIQPVPSATLYGKKNNLKKIKSFKKLRQTRKVSNQKELFLYDMKEMLASIVLENDADRKDLLIEIVNIAHDYFIYGDQETRETSINDAVQELLLPFFDGNKAEFKVDLLSIRKSIIKSNIFRRTTSRVYNFFCSIVKHC